MPGSGGDTTISRHAARRPVETDRLTERRRTYAGSRSQMCGSGELRWNEGRLKRLPEEGKEGGLKGTYCMQSFSQAILPGLIQRLRDAGLTKAPRTPGLQDFLRIMSTGRCTWDHLLWENIRNYKLCIMRIKSISRCGLPIWLGIIRATCKCSCSRRGETRPKTCLVADRYYTHFGSTERLGNGKKEKRKATNAYPVFGPDPAFVALFF